MNEDVLGGVVEIAFRNFTIPAHLLGEPSISIEEGTRERTTQAGTFRRGSGTLDTAEITIPMYIPSWDWFGENIMRARYTAGTGENTGNVIWNANTCSGSVDAGKVNFHYVCDTNDNNDIFFYNASMRVNINPTFATGEDLMVELTFLANPDEDGNVYRLGTGDVTDESIYDVTTQTTIDVV